MVSPVRRIVVLASLLAGCGGAPPPATLEEPIAPPRARLLDGELRAPEGVASRGDFELELPALGSELPSVIVIPPAEAAP